MTCRLYEAREVAEAMGGQENPEQVANDLGVDAQRVLDLSANFEGLWLESLDQNFNTAKGMAALFELVRAVNRFANHKKARKRGGPVVAEALKCFDLVSQSVGLLAQDVGSYMEEVKTKRLAAMGVQRDEIEALLVARAEARASKDWAAADQIRDTLQEKRIVVMDRPEGVEWRVRIGA